MTTMTAPMVRSQQIGPCYRHCQVRSGCANMAEFRSFLITSHIHGKRRRKVSLLTAWPGNRKICFSLPWTGLGQSHWFNYYVQFPLHVWSMQCPISVFHMICVRWCVGCFGIRLVHEHGGTHGMIGQARVRQGCVLSPRCFAVCCTGDCWLGDRMPKQKHMVLTSAVTGLVYWTHVPHQHPAELHHLAGYLWRFWNEAVQTSVWAV